MSQQFSFTLNYNNNETISVMYSLPVVTPDVSGAGGQAVVFSLGVSGGSSLC